jgi:four helix bundle protein
MSNPNRPAYKNYPEWMDTVPDYLKNDPIWKLDAYKFALFVDDLGEYDILHLKNAHVYDIADQLKRSLDSISVNLTEGYSRSKGLDRARFLEYSLGSARESREWYYKSRQVLKPKVIEHRTELLTRIIAMLTSMIRNQRENSIREEQTEYSTDQKINSATEIPFT